MAMTQHGRLNGKVVLITGAAGGQGAAHARACANEGASVTLADVADGAGKELAESLRAQGHRATYVHLDVSDEASWADAVALTEQEFGPVTTLVNNAGISARDGVQDLSPAGWDRVIAVNQTGVAYGMRAVIPGMIAREEGSIINISSLWAHTGGSGEGSIGYVASKAAVLGMTRNVALDLGPKGIRVNSISPGYLDHVMTKDDSLESVAAGIPLRRLAKVEDITGPVLFLASNESRYVTGIDILVDGGLHLG